MYETSACVSHCTLADLTCIKIFVLVTLVIFGIVHYRGHLCFTNVYVFSVSADLFYSFCKATHKKELYPRQIIKLNFNDDYQLKGSLH